MSFSALNNLKAKESVGVVEYGLTKVEISRERDNLPWIISEPNYTLKVY